ncbi:hypothetical protein ALP36_101448 [Pseudomonas syringae pv. coriandricola]|uniref:Uncharacterized protein n=1 Tax=Pseudomonas syringae pv. coriandricola TaxID=264453 RepID=A0A3M5RDB6_9PSED|nr:hypothetical protein ALP36_101448 [Pseudomonas syringae pv. coriandricola]
MLMPITYSDLSYCLDLDQVRDDRVHVLPFVEQDRTEALAQIRLAHLVQLQIAVVRHGD